MLGFVESLPTLFCASHASLPLPFLSIGTTELCKDDPEAIPGFDPRRGDGDLVPGGWCPPGFSPVTASAVDEGAVARASLPAAPPVTGGVEVDDVEPDVEFWALHDDIPVAGYGRLGGEAEASGDGSVSMFFARESVGQVGGFGAPATFAVEPIEAAKDAPSDAAVPTGQGAYASLGGDPSAPPAFAYQPLGAPTGSASSVAAYQPLVSGEGPLIGAEEAGALAAAASSYEPLGLGADPVGTANFYSALGSLNGGDPPPYADLVPALVEPPVAAATAAYQPLGLAAYQPLGGGSEAAGVAAYGPLGGGSEAAGNGGYAPLGGAAAADVIESKAIDDTPTKAGKDNLDNNALSNGAAWVDGDVLSGSPLVRREGETVGVGIAPIGEAATAAAAAAAEKEVLRDWNEEFQAILELPTATPGDRLYRAHLVRQLSDEFEKIAVAEGMKVRALCVCV